MFSQEIETKSRLLAKLVRELLTAETFDSLPDLTEALKCRCARLKIVWTNDEISDAYQLIESNTPLPGIQLPRRLEERPADPQIIDRKFAGEFLRDFPTLVNAIQTPESQDAHEARVRAQAAESHRIARPRRRHLQDRLEDIFRTVAQ